MAIEAKALKSPPPSRAETRDAAALHQPGSRAARLNAAAPVQRLRATSDQLNAGRGVVQRLVMTKIIDDKIVYYSSFDKRRTFDSYADALDHDRLLEPRGLNRALGTVKTPKRTPTPYGYGPKESVSAAPNKSNAGPHTLSFSSTEHRIRKRFSKNQGNQLPRQVITPERFAQLVDVERPVSWMGSSARRRMIADYATLYQQFLDAVEEGDFSERSHFHLLLRHLMQMHPYTTYGNREKSKYNAERRNSRFGTRSIDPSTVGKVKNRENLEDFLELRKELFHDSDSETDGEDYEPFKFTTRKPKKKKKTRKRAKIDFTPFIADDEPSGGPPPPDDDFDWGGSGGITVDS